MVSGTAGCAGVGRGAADARTSARSMAGCGVASGAAGALAGAGAVKAASVRAASSSVTTSAARETGRRLTMAAMRSYTPLLPKAEPSGRGCAHISSSRKRAQA